MLPKLIVEKINYLAKNHISCEKYDIHTLKNSNYSREIIKENFKAQMFHYNITTLYKYITLLPQDQEQKIFSKLKKMDLKGLPDFTDIKFYNELQCDFKEKVELGNRNTALINSLTWTVRKKSGGEEANTFQDAHKMNYSGWLDSFYTGFIKLKTDPVNWKEFAKECKEEFIKSGLIDQDTINKCNEDTIIPIINDMIDRVKAYRNDYTTNKEDILAEIANSDNLAQQMIGENDRCESSFLEHTVRLNTN